MEKRSERRRIERSISSTDNTFPVDECIYSKKCANEKKQMRKSAKTYQPEYAKTIICVLALLTSLSLNQLVICLAHDVVSRNALPDLVFSIVSEQEWALFAGDMLTSMAGILALGFIIIFHRYRVIVLRRLIFTITVLYTFRAICLAVTHIPPSYNDNYRKCIKPNHGATVKSILKRFIQHAFKLGLQVGEDGKLFCGDLLFSGHTIFVSTTTFYFNHYSPHSIWPLSIYHSFVLLPHHLRARSRPYRRLLLFWTMYELEINVPSGRVPNEVEWPLPWPKCLKKCVENWNRRQVQTTAGCVAEQLDAHRIKTHL
uniref:Sphingomyelin synthase-like domain-containing protein n=1 Tax=Setaria digitata TaxID=48799 RepID=A0A915Q4S7_9BILA